VDYRKDIRPILQERCYACHGALKQKAKLRLDSGAGMLKGEVVVPGKASESELITRVSAKEEDGRMPPEGHPLKPEQISLLKSWIEQGAKVPADDAPEPDPRDHWSFRPAQRPKVPGPGNPIDAFVSAEWAKRGLKPVAPADKRILLRRVYLDLIGLPPTTEQIDAFLKDTSPTAYEKVVDQLLASPQYGERWGRHFLDIWRYSDWWGLGAELRNSQKHIWHWRDWVVESLNADVGYDEMVRQMLAADELYPTDVKKLRATGYLARPYFLFNRTSWLDEVVEHTSKGILGLTTNCAKCHDHKYDPVSQLDYYRLRAVFEPYQVRMDLVPGELDPEKAGIPRAFDCNLDAKTPFHVRGDERNPDPKREVLPGLPGFLAPDGLKASPVKLPPLAYKPRPEVVETYRKAAEAKLAAAKEAAAKLLAAHGGRGEPFVWAAKSVAAKPVKAAEAELAKANAGDVRGAIKAKESNIETDASRNRPFPDTSTGRRSALAKWATDAKNPLTARVAVNHVWARHFGQPLVATVFDFGRKGSAPSHPELLDWLAAELMERGWSFKHLHRLVVTSNVYRLSSSSRDADANIKIDPENRALWRMNGVRMQAQVVRDSLLRLSGELDLTTGGPPVPLDQQDTSKRRAMYFFHSHNEHHKLLGIFDDANVLDCYRRTESIVPQQALALWNSRFAQTAAAKIADKLPAGTDAVFVTAAFETVLGTTPTRAELAACEASLSELKEVLKELKDAERTKRARTQLVQALLNHNDFITVR
ncbi:MAG TPA: PSD1 and planctomycete cytochrome C domain-containing protein, partial [Gemmataceae bacterium]|nr:PSD1 and planctomycete cytochrome C domain-containing protein [Gemmataceae bacterium]